MSKLALRLAAALLVLLTWRVAHAEEDRKARARAYYIDGITLLQSGDDVGAARELSVAYALNAHPRIAYDLAEVYEKLDRPVRAAKLYRDALDGVGLDDERRAHASARLPVLSARIAALTIECAVPGARVRINGEDVGKTPLQKPVSVRPGRVFVEVSARGREPTTEVVSVKPGFQSSVTITLVAASSLPAEVTIDTTLLDAEIWVDDKLRGRTPETKLVMVAAGERVIALKRTGYTTAETKLRLKSGEKIAVPLKAKPAQAAVANGGSVELRLEPPDANVFIDGATHRQATVQLPTGRHRVSIRKEGFMRVEREVEVTRDETTVLALALPPAPERRDAMIAQAESDRTAVWALGAVGVALTLGGIGVTIWSVGRLVDANTAIDGVERSVDCTSVDDQAQARCATALSDVEGERDASVGFVAGGAVGLALGVAAFSISVYLFTESRDPDELRVELPPELGSVQFAPDLLVTANAAMFGLRGRF